MPELGIPNPLLCRNPSACVDVIWLRFWGSTRHRLGASVRRLSRRLVAMVASGFFA